MSLEVEDIVRWKGCDGDGDGYHHGNLCSMGGKVSPCQNVTDHE